MATCTVNRTTPPPAPPPEVESVTITMTKRQADKLVALLGGLCGGSFTNTSLPNVFEALNDALGEDRIGFFKDYFEVVDGQIYEISVH